MAINKASTTSKAAETKTQEEEFETTAVLDQEIFDDEIPKTTNVTERASTAQSTSREVGQARPQASTAKLSDEEMEDLEFGFGTFPLITLNGTFDSTDDKLEIEDGFECVIQSYKARYIYRVDEDNFFYTYYNPKRDSDDLRVTTSGASMDDQIAEWDEEGMKHEIKKYLEVVVLLKGVNEGKIAILSISPTSVGRFSGYVAMELKTLKNLHYSRVITKVSVGAKIKSKFAFNPWHFEFLSEL